MIESGYSKHNIENNSFMKESNERQDQLNRE